VFTTFDKRASRQLGRRHDFRPGRLVHRGVLRIAPE